MSFSPLINSFSFNDFDHFASGVQQGDIAHQQLSAGQFSGSLRQIVGQNVILAIHEMNQFILQEGSAIEGFVTFLIPGDMKEGFTWRCNQLKSNVIGVIQNGMEHMSILPPDFIGMPMSVRTGYLESVATSLGIDDFMFKISKEECIEVSQQQSDGIRSEILSVFQVPSLLDEYWEEELVIRLIQCLIYGKGEMSKMHGGTRRKIYAKAVRFMQERVMEPISVKDVSEAVGVSERNLRYAFHEVAKMSPKRFFDRLRLNAVRKHLRSGSFQNVLDVSHTFGYWHSGKFAADYKSLFLEYPSESLLKVY